MEGGRPRFLTCGTEAAVFNERLGLACSWSAAAAGDLNHLPAAADFQQRLEGFKMLVLSRAKNERINVNCACGRCTQVVASGVSGSKQKIGFEAPADVKIVREELSDRQWPLPGQQPSGDQHAA